MIETALIALDWGTTSARAYRLGVRGDVLEQNGHPLGIGAVRDGDFAGAFAALLGSWATLPVPRIACGMIGSRQGWVEVPYGACPAPLSALAGNLARTPGGELAIVPGISCVDAAGVPDVIRGEETQILGVAGDGPSDGAEVRLVVLPGTHSKWAIVAGGTIRTFATFMTGEFFAVLRDHSILGRMMAPEDEAGAESATAFRRGVGHGLDAAGRSGLLHALFGARTLALFGELTPPSAAAYLSGLLIGEEIRCGTNWARQHGAERCRPVLVGAAGLVERYAQAFAVTGADTETGAEDAAALGLWRIARSAGLVAGGA